MGNCIGSPPPPPGASRAARCLAVAGGRHFYVWQEWHAENSRLLGKLRAAAQAMANLPVRRGLNQWQSVCEAEREAKRKLLEAVKGIANVHIRKAFVRWAETCAAANAKKAKLRSALAGFTPEGRAKKAVLRKIAWIRKRRLAMQKAMAGFRLAGCRSALHAMRQQVRASGLASQRMHATAALTAGRDVALASLRERSGRRHLEGPRHYPRYHPRSRDAHTHVARSSACAPRDRCN